MGFPTTRVATPAGSHGARLLVAEEHEIGVAPSLRLTRPGTLFCSLQHARHAGEHDAP